MAGRGVKRSRRRCDYGCGGRHARARAVVCPCPCPPLFVRARARCRSSAPFPAVVYPCPCVPFRARLRRSPFVPARLHWLALVLIAVRSCPSPLVRARLRSFAGPRLSPPVCVRSVVLVPVRLCLSPLPDCACLAFARARWCSLGFVCAGSAFVRARLGFVVLVYALMGFFWAPKPLVCVCIKYILVHK
jgi:hypothetical protein